MLLLATPQDWLPKGHLAYLISDTIEVLDLGAFYARYAGGGARNQPFHPSMMVKLLVYGYATGVFSSRNIERCVFRRSVTEHFGDVTDARLVAA